MDTWIRKGLQRDLFQREKAGEKNDGGICFHHFGPYAGYAQLYLFHFWRHHPLDFSEQSFRLHWVI